MGIITYLHEVYLKRHQLPQIPSDKFDDFRLYLKQNGIQSMYAEVNPEKLQPLQTHVNKNKLKNMIKNVNVWKLPIVVVGHGHVVDGHHRYILAKLLKKPSIHALVCACSVPKFVKLAHDFEHSFTKTIDQ